MHFEHESVQLSPWTTTMYVHVIDVIDVVIVHRGLIDK